MEWWEILIIVVVSIIGIVILYFLRKEYVMNREYDRRFPDGKPDKKGPDISNQRIFDLTKEIRYDLHPEVSGMVEDPMTYEGQTIVLADVKNDF